MFEEKSKNLELGGRVYGGGELRNKMKSRERVCEMRLRGGCVKWREKAGLKFWRVFTKMPLVCLFLWFQAYPMLKHC